MIIDDHHLQVTRGSINRIVLKSPNMDSLSLRYNSLKIYDDNTEVENISAERISEDSYRFDLVIDDKYSEGEYKGELKGEVNGKPITHPILVTVGAVFEPIPEAPIFDPTLPREMQDWN